MTFISILIALVIERFFHWSHLRHWNWFQRYQHFLSVRMGTRSNVLLLIVAVLPIVLIFGFLGWLFSGWLYGIPKILFGILVLLYCMGPQNLWVQIYGCIRVLNKEEPQAAIDQVKTTFGFAVPDQPQAFHQAFTRAIFIAANQRIFAVIFWFIVLGPAGAVLYRAVSLSAENVSFGIMTVATQALRLLDWIPVRIFSFLFALGGHFTKVFSFWKKYLREGIHFNDTLLGDCGIAALSPPDIQNIPEDGSMENEALMLLDRVFIIMLVFLALVVFAV